MHRGCRDPLNGSHPWYVLLELSSQAREGLRAAIEEILAAGAEQNLVTDATIAASLEQAKAFWLLRHHIADTQKYEGGSIKHDVSVPVKAVPDFIVEASAAVEAMIAGCRPCPFGHLGDGNVHFNVTQPLGADRAAFLAHWDEVNAAVFAIVARAWRLDLGRARHRRDEARAPAGREGSGRAQPDARPQAHARPQRHPQSG